MFSIFLHFTNVLSSQSSENRPIADVLGGIYICASALVANKRNKINQ